MADIAIRLYRRLTDETIEDSRQEFGIESFAGQVPAIGDLILVPGVLQGVDRHDPANRRLWKVVARVFNPRDMEDYVALVVEERSPETAEHAFVAG
jgi:hypothetical protein